MTPEELFALYRPGVQDVCDHLRGLVKEVLPDAEETVFAGYKNVSYGTGHSRADEDLICYIAPFKTSANLGFYRGALLPDPHGLLRGTGKLLRHAKFPGHEEIDDARVVGLLQAAREERLGTGSPPS